MESSSDIKAQLSLRSYLDSDGVMLTSLLNTGMGAAIGQPGPWNESRLKSFLKTFVATQTFVLKKGLKTVEAGFVGLTNYNSISNRAEMVFLCLSPVVNCTMPDSRAVELAVDWAFGRMRLNKITVQIIEGNEILGYLEEAGFTAEGVRQSEYVIGGEAKDVTVCSISSHSWKPKL